VSTSPLVLIALLGDIMLGRGVNMEIPRREPEYFWGTTLPLLRSADAVFANLECAITPHTQPWSKSYKVFNFRANPEAIKILQTATISCVSLANNHSLDFEIRGLLDTIQYLNQAHIAHAGAGVNQEGAQTPAILDIQGIKVGFVAATDNEPAFAAGKQTPGTNYTNFDLHKNTLDRLQNLIDQAKLMKAELIILSLHWGPNMVQVPPQRFRNFARRAIDMGVNVIHGHSAHLFQGVEFYKDGVIFYDTGDFIDDYARDPQLRNDWSFIFMIAVEKTTEGPIIKKVKAVPVQLQYAQTNLATGEEAKAIVTRMRKLCEPFGSITRLTLGGLNLFPNKTN